MDYWEGDSALLSLWSHDGHDDDHDDDRHYDGDGDGDGDEDENVEQNDDSRLTAPLLTRDRCDTSLLVKS